MSEMRTVTVDVPVTFEVEVSHDEDGVGSIVRVVKAMAPDFGPREIETRLVEAGDSMQLDLSEESDDR